MSNTASNTASNTPDTTDYSYNAAYIAACKKYKFIEFDNVAVNKNYITHVTNDCDKYSYITLSAGLKYSLYSRFDNPADCHYGYNNLLKALATHRLEN